MQEHQPVPDQDCCKLYFNDVAEHNQAASCQIQSIRCPSACLQLLLTRSAQPSGCHQHLIHACHMPTFHLFVFSSDAWLVAMWQASKSANYCCSNRRSTSGCWWSSESSSHWPSVSCKRQTRSSHSQWHSGTFRSATLLHAWLIKVHVCLCHICLRHV